MINLRAPWQEQSWTENSVQFSYLLVRMYLPQLSRAKRHLKISTTKNYSAYLTTWRERALQKSLSWTVYGFSIVCARPWTPATCQLAAAVQPRDKPCPSCQRALMEFIVTLPWFVLFFAYLSPNHFSVKILVVRRNCISGSWISVFPLNDVSGK